MGPSRAARKDESETLKEKHLLLQIDLLPTMTQLHVQFIKIYVLLFLDNKLLHYVVGRVDDLESQVLSSGPGSIPISTFYEDNVFHSASLAIKNSFNALTYLSCAVILFINAALHFLEQYHLPHSHLGNLLIFLICPKSSLCKIILG